MKDIKDCSILMAPIRWLAALTGNSLAQGFLDKNIRVSQFLAGIGAGTHSQISGEDAVFNLVRKRSSGPLVIFDVGANVGQFSSLAIERLNGLAFTLHCFEPCVETFGLLQRKLPAGDWISLNRCALGSSRGTSVLHYDDPTSGLASMTKRDLQHYGIELSHAEAIQVETVDDYCAGRGIERIHLLKIDVEGHEMDVMQGASEALAKQSIDTILFEFGGTSIDTRRYFRDYFSFLSDHNFRIARVTPSGYLRPIKKYHESHEQFFATNFIAISNASTSGMLGF